MKRKVFIMAMTACLIGASMGTSGVTMAEAAEENSVETGSTEAEEGVEENRRSFFQHPKQFSQKEKAWDRTTRKSLHLTMKKWV